MLPPTSDDLRLDETRPYFLWWLDATVGDLREKLRSADEEERAYWLGALLREANTRDVWLYTSVQGCARRGPAFGAISENRATCGVTCCSCRHRRGWLTVNERGSLGWDDRVVPPEQREFLRRVQTPGACRLAGGAVLSGVHLAHRLAGIDPGVLSLLLRDFPTSPLPVMLRSLQDGELQRFREELMERLRSVALSSD